MRWIVVFILFNIVIFTLSISFAQDIEQDMSYQNLYEKAEQAVQVQDAEKADFYLAQYLAMSLLDKHGQRGPKDLIELFTRYKDSRSTSMICGKYDREFLELFFISSYAQWGSDYGVIHEDTCSFEIVKANNAKYFVSLIANPYIEMWDVVDGNNSYFAPIILADFETKPYLIAGELEKGVVSKKFKDIVLDIGGNSLHYVWRPQFHDLDGDGIPEIWLRYIFAHGHGFSQELAIYKIDHDKKLRLFEKFTGIGDGIAKRFNNRMVEVASGYKDSFEDDEVGYDKMHYEMWEFKDNAFKLILEKDMPHVLLSKGWKEYYIENGNL